MLLGRWKTARHQNFLLSFFGLSVSSPAFLKYLMLLIFFPTTLVLTAFSLFDLVHKEIEVDYVADIFESVSSYGQAIIRLTLMLRHFPLIRDMLLAHDHFWAYDSFGAELEHRLKRRMANAWTLARCLWFMSFSTCVLVILMPVFSDLREMPLAGWTPESPVGKTALYWTQMVGIAAAHTTIVVFDGFLVLTCTEIRNQFALLCGALNSIKIKTRGHEKNVKTRLCSSEEMASATLKDCVLYHNFLLNIYEKLSVTYSEFFIGQYFISLSGVCMEMFIMVDPSTIIGENSEIGFIKNLKSTVYCVALLLQLSMLFIPASNISEQAEEVSQALYNINWYDDDCPMFRKELLITFVKVQKTLNMSGGGLFVVNKNTYIQLFRTAFSIATVMERMKRRGGGNWDQ